MTKVSMTVRSGAAAAFGYGATRVAVLRGALLGTTAIVGVALAGPATAQANGATFNVTSAADTTTGNTLRAAILYANANAGTTITFDAAVAGQTITLASELPIITGNNTIIDGGSQAVTISGNNAYRAFFIGDAGQLGLGAGYIAHVTIENLTVKNAVAIGGDGGGARGGGGAGLGGAVFVSSTADLTLSNVSLTADGAKGGNGGTGSSYGSGGGMGGNGGSPSGAGGGGFGRTATGGAGGTAGAGGAGSFTDGVHTSGTGGAATGGGGANGGGGGGSTTVGGGGGGVGGAAGTSTTGGAGGFGGGGGDAPNAGGDGGAGGYGGGGGGALSGNPVTSNGGAGGFGGGGGGHGGDGSTTPGGAGGFGGGAGAPNGGRGGGGGGLGGAIFVQSGGGIHFVGTVTSSGNTAIAGAGYTSGIGAGQDVFLAGNGALTFAPASGVTETFNGSIADQTGSGGTGANAGSYSLTQSGAGTVILAGANTFSGGTTLAAGNLQAASTGALSSGAISFTGGTLQYGGTNVTDYSGRFSTANGQLYSVDTNGNNVTYATALTSSGGSLTKLGSGTLTLTGANTYTGGTTISAGVLKVSTNSLPAAGNVTDNATLTFDQTGLTGVYSGVISGSGGVTEIGAGTLLLDAVSTFTGATTLTSGSLTLLGTGSIAASSGLTIAAGTLTVSGGPQSLRSLSGTAGTVDLGAGNTLTLTNATGSFAGDITQDSGAGALHLTGGTETLSGANTYSGGTTIDSGTTLTAARNTAIGTGAVVDNGTLAFNGASGTVTNGVSGSGGVTVANVGAGNTLTLSGSLTSTGGFNVTDASTVTLTGSSTGHTVTVSGAGATLNNLGTAAVVNGVFATAGATINNGDATHTAASIEGVTNASGVITQGAANSTVNNYGLIKGDQYSGVGQNSGTGGITVHNFGTGVIYGQGSATGSYGVFNNQNGALTLTNDSDGVVVGSQYGVYGTGTATVVTNTGTIASGSYTAGAITVGGNAGINLTSGGTITNGTSAGTTAANAASVIKGSVGVQSATALTLTNYGVVTGANASVAGVNASGTGNTITNYGTVEGGAQGVVLNSGGTVYNYGTGSVLRANSATGLNDASGIYANGALTLNNQGAISTASTGISYGVEVIGAATLTNGGSIVATSGASGLRVDGGGSIVNTGTITGAAGGIKSNGNGTNLILVNTGTITSRGVTTRDNDDGVFAAGSAMVLNTGTITAAAYAGIIAVNGGATITNAGVLTGGNGGATGVAVHLASGGTFTNYGQASSAGGHGVYSGSAIGSTVVLQAGSTTGDIVLGGGADTLTLYNGRGAGAAATTTTYTDPVTGAVNTVTLQNADLLAAAVVGGIDLGGGANVIGLRGIGDGTNGAAGTLALNTVGNVGTITKQDSGTWTLGGAASASIANATINAGIGGTPGSGGLLILSGSGLTGTIYVNGAAVQANGSSALGTGTVHMVDPTLVFANTSATYANNFVLDVAAPGQGSPSDTSNDPSSFQANTGVTATVTGAITTGTGNNVNGYAIDAVQPVVFAGAGTVVLTNAGNAWTGVTTVNAGSTLEGQTTTISGASITDNGVLRYNQITAAGIVAKNITGTGSLTKTGAQTVTLTGTNDYAGGTSVTQGTLALGNGGATGTIAGNVALSNNAVLQINRSGNPTVANTVTGTGTVQVSANAVLTGSVTASSGVNIDAGITAGVGSVSATDIEAVSLGTGATVNVAGTLSSTGGYGVAANTGGTINVAQGGIVYGTGAQAIYAGAAITLDNAGLVQTTVAGDSAIFYGAQATGTTSTITNRGTGQIIGVASGINALNAGAGTITIVNEAGGRISGANTAATLVTASSTNNAGKMVGATGGLTTTATASVVNSGLIGTGTLATDGTYMPGGSGPAIQIATGGSSIANTGTINGATRGVSLTGTGAYSVINSGTGMILGRGDDGVTDSGALTLVNGVGATIQSTVNSGVAITGSGTVYNGGALTGGSNATNGYGFRSNTASATTLNNYGMATGSQGGIVALGTGAVTANLYAGSTTGAVVLGSAADTLTLYTGTGTANAGAAYNTATGLVEAAATSDAMHVLLQGANTRAAAVVGTINLGGGANVLGLRGIGDGSAANGVAGTVDLSTVSNVGTITKQDTGIWTLTGAATASVAAARINAGTGSMLGNQGTLVFAGSGLTGTIYVNGAVAQATGAGTLGTGVVHMVDPTLVFATTSATYANNFVLDVARPGQGSPSDTSNDPSTFSANTGVTATLTGTITTGTGSNVNGYAIDPVQPVVIAGAGTIVLTNGGNAWTGVTTVNNGSTLRGTTASLSGGSFTDNGTLNVNQAVAGTSARAISGSGNVLIDGGGPVTLTGAITVGGGVQIGANTTATLSNVSGSNTTLVTLSGNSAILNVASGGNLTATNAGAVFGTGQNATVGNAGTITSTGGFVAVYFNPNTGTNTVTNNGTITGSNAIFSASTLNLTNTGTLTGQPGTAVFTASGSAAATIVNSGTIQSGSNGNANGISLNAGGTVTNNASGQITGTSRGVSIGGASSTVNNYGRIVGGTDNAVSLFAGGNATNYAGGTLTATTAGGWGVYTAGAGAIDNQGTINADSGVVSNSATAPTVTNEGTITATVNGVWGLGTAVNLTNTGTISAGTTGVRAEAAGSSITNAGMIAGSASGAIGVYMTGGTLTNQSGGVISAGQTNGVYGTAIQLVGTGNVLALQAGSTVNGRIDASGTTDASNSYTFTGALNGGFVGGSGNDTVTLVTPVTVTGTLDGGAGTDTLVLDGTAAGSLNSNQVVNFEGGVKKGSGTWTLTGTTPASPTAFAISSGTLNVAGGNALADNATVTIAAGGTLGLLASETIDGLAGPGAATLGANTLTVGGGNGGATFAGVASGTGGLTKAGTGTQTLSGANTYTGATTINIGTLALGASNVLADVSAVSVSTGSTFDLGANSDTVASLTLAGTLAGTGTLTAGTYTLNGAAVNANLGTGTLVQASGASMLNGTTATNVVNVNGGTLSLGASDRIVDTANVAIASGATLNLAAFSDTVGAATVAGTLAGTGTLAAGIYTLNGAAVNANLGTGTLVQASGASMLNGTTATNVVNVNGGTLSLGASDRIVDTANVAIASGATLNLAAFNDTVGAAIIAGTLAGGGTLTASTYTLNGAAVAANLGTGVLTQASGTSTLSGTSAAAATNVSVGTLRLGASDRIVDTSVVTIANGATFDLAGYNETIGTLAGAGVVTLGTGTLTTGGNNVDTTFSGRMSGTGNLTKVGTGTLTLTGANTLTGAINANAGTLLLLGSTAGSVRVSGATLSGTGQVAGNLAVSSGTLSVGTPTQAIGSLSTGSLTVTGGTTVFDFAGATGGFTSDRINVAGAVNLTGGLVSARATEGSANYRVMQTYTLIQAGSVAGTFANGGTFTQAANATDLFYRLRYDLVPGSVLLEVRKQIDFAAGLVGASGNQLAVANAFNGSALGASDVYATALNAIQALSPADRAAAYNSISGEGIADLTTSVALMNQRFTELLRRRLSTAGGSTANGNLVAALVGGRRGLANARAAGELGGQPAGATSAFADGTGGEGTRGGAWVQSFGGYGLLRGQAGSANLFDQSYGIAGGLDARVGPVMLGIAGSGAGVDTRVAARATKGNGTIYQGAGYAAYDDGRLFANAIGTYFSGDVASRRSVFVGAAQQGVASGKARTHGYGGSIAAGYRIDLGGGTTYTPQVSFEATRVKRAAFTETGIGVLNLAAASQRRTLYQADAEGRLSHRFALGGAGSNGGGTIEPYVGGGFNANWGDRQALNTMQITGAPAGTGAFVIDGAHLARYTGLVTGGIDGHPSDRVTLGVGFQAHRSPRQKDGAVQVHAKIAF